MIHEISNGKLRIKADSEGAELKSVKLEGDKEGTEYLWQLNPDIWDRQAPLLFPIIGRLKNERYTVGGEEFEIPIHGFARFIEFDVVEKSEKQISFGTRHSSETLKQYPFHFDLRIGYELKDDTIVKSHRVENTGHETMFYEIGGHEGYNLALFPGEKMEDYFISFPGMEEIETYTSDRDVMMNKGKKTIALDKGRLFLSPEVFINDALIIDTFNQRRVILENLVNDRKVEVEFEDFKYLGIWTKNMRANYVCIEPWSSLPDCNYLGSELEKKKDVRKLEPGKAETLKYEIKIR